MRGDAGVSVCPWWLLPMVIISEFLAYGLFWALEVSPEHFAELAVAGYSWWMMLWSTVSSELASSMLFGVAMAMRA